MLLPHELPAAQIINPRGGSAIVLACEHASPFIPAQFDGLGLAEEDRLSHAAWDPGAFALALEISARLDAPLVASRVSRLVYDCNRPPEAPDACPAKSERIEVPGNRNLSTEDKALRVKAVYQPFQALLAETLANRRADSILVTLHSFAPVFHGRARDVQIGFLHDDTRDQDTVVAEAVLSHMNKRISLDIRLNEPYAAADGVTHTLREHAARHGRDSLMIEVRNDLLRETSGIYQIAGVLSEALADTVEEFEGTR